MPPQCYTQFPAVKPQRFLCLWEACLPGKPFIFCTSRITSCRHGKMHPLQGREQKRNSLDFSRLFRFGGRNRTRTCDPIDVNDVLYQLSHATKSFCVPPCYIHGAMHNTVSTSLGTRCIIARRRRDVNPSSSVFLQRCINRIQML